MAGLLDITDRTKVEWVELFADLEHQGLYQAGDMIGLGVLICDQCGHKTEFNHPTEIEPVRNVAVKRLAATTETLVG